MMFHYLNYKTMATKNISELIKSATDYVDYTSGYAHLFADNKGGDKCIQSVCKIGKHTYMGKITEISEIQKKASEMCGLMLAS